MGSRDTRRLRIKLSEVKSLLHSLLERVSLLEEELGEVERSQRSEVDQRSAVSPQLERGVSAISRCRAQSL